MELYTNKETLSTKISKKVNGVLELFLKIFVKLKTDINTGG